MIIDVDDTVEIVDLKDYPPQFGLKEGQTGKIMSLFKYKGHAVAQVLPDDERRLKYNMQYRTYPLSVSRLARITAMLLALFLPYLAAAQDNLQVSKRPTAGEVATAKATIQAAQDAPTLLAYGGYAVIDIKLEGKLTNYVVPGSDDCLRTVSIPKGQGYQGWLVAKGETAPKWTVIAPIATHDRLMVTGTANGATTLIWMTVSNGEAVVVAAFKFIVGTPRPPPPPPDTLSDFEKALKKALEADITAGKGTKAQATMLAGVYRSAANSLPSVTTVGELYATLQKAIATAGVPPPATALPTMRQLIAAELNKRLPTDADRQLTLEDRNRITATFGAMADSLEAVLAVKGVSSNCGCDGSKLSSFGCKCKECKCDLHIVN